MKESKFYEMCENVEKLGDLTQGNFPTVDELKVHSEDHLKTKYVPLLIYFAADPLSKTNYAGAATEAYKETVTYCKNLLCDVPLEEE
jgi:hypothetical protein